MGAPPSSRRWQGTDSDAPLLFAPLLQAHIRFVGLDQAFQARLHLGRHARAAPGFLALVALLGLAHQHLVHLGVDEVVEQPAGARQILSGVTYGPLAVPPCSAISFSCVVPIRPRWLIAWSRLPVATLTDSAMSSGHFVGSQEAKALPAQYLTGPEAARLMAR
jgi:hypothetical protein